MAEGNNFKVGKVVFLHHADLLAFVYLYNNIVYFPVDKVIFLKVIVYLVV